MDTTILPRLRWACRRGMLELDVLLGNFLEEAYADLSPIDQALFVALLDCEDQEIFMWLTAKEVASDPKIASIVEKIRHHAKTRKHASVL